MIKLVNIYEDFITLSDFNSNNVDIADIADNDKVNHNLIKDIDTAARKAGLKIKITHAVTGHRTYTSSGNISRHTTGNAVDINTIDGISGNTPIFKEKANKLVDELQKLGYEHTTSESGKDKVIIWDSPNHYSHIHVSVQDGSKPSSTSTTNDQKSLYTGFGPIDALIKLTGKGLGLEEELKRIKQLIK
jgi:hypothetical protein